MICSEGENSSRALSRRLKLTCSRRSTGYGSLQIWIRYLRQGITFQETFESSEKYGCPTTSWKGNAFKIEGGYTWSDVIGEAARRDVVVVGGGTPVSHKAIRDCSKILLNVSSQ